MSEQTRMGNPDLFATFIQQSNASGLKLIDRMKKDIASLTIIPPNQRTKQFAQPNEAGF